MAFQYPKINSSENCILPRYVIGLLNIKENFHFMLFMQFKTESRNSLKDTQKSQMMPDQVALLRLQQKQLCTWWKS
jgi:hypothetical protein